MSDALGSIGTPSENDETAAVRGGRGFLFRFGLNLGRTARFLKNGPVWLAKDVGRSMALPARKISALARRTAPGKREAQGSEADAPPLPGQLGDNAVAASPAEKDHPIGDTEGALTMEPDLKDLEDLIGKKRKEK